MIGFFAGREDGVHGYYGSHGLIKMDGWKNRIRAQDMYGLYSSLLHFALICLHSERHLGTRPWFYLCHLYEIFVELDGTYEDRKDRQEGIWYG